MITLARVAFHQAALVVVVVVVTAAVHVDGVRVCLNCGLQLDYFSFSR
jgi:hypothetical protein